MRVAAAVLAAELGTEEVVEVLESAAGHGSTQRDARLDLALLAALAAESDGERVAEVAGRLHDRALDDGISVFGRVGKALRQVDRTTELEAIAGERLAVRPDDPAALRTLSWLTLDRGEIDRATDLLDRLLASDDVRSDDFNNAAWLALARSDPPTPRDLDLARRAVEMTGARSNASLHTLAALYAADGKPAESYRLLLQSIEAESGAADECDLLVLGLLARAYELPQAAERYFRRTVDESPAEDCDRLTSCCRLAGARLAPPPPGGEPAGGSPGPIPGVR
jgi:tetratricopeptide (TPR) repeat protein